ncbi:hypothetical protein SOPP22_19755, partial [Shewanella sp. OPT22]
SNVTQAGDESSLVRVDSTTDVQQLQAIIAAGGDPTIDLPETAAGGPTGNQGGFDAVALDRNAAETVASTVFDTLGFIPVSPDVATLAVDSINTPPVIGDPGLGVVDESGVDLANNDSAGTASVTGIMTASDAENQNELNWSLQTVQNQFGVFSIDSVTGAWSFLLDNTADVVQALQEGESRALVYTVQVNDGQGGVAQSTVTITVEGTNDRPIITGEQFAGSVSESGTNASNEDSAGVAIATGLLTATDVDNAQSDLSWTVQSEQNAFGTFEIDAATGEWTFTLDNDASAVQSLQEGEFETISYVVRVSDGLGGFSDTTVTITVTGTNDRPLVSNGPQTGNVDEAGVDASNNDIPGTPSVSGDLNATDVDNDQSDLSWALISDQFADYGEFILNSVTGEWTFNLFNDSAVVEAMQEGDT